MKRWMRLAVSGLACLVGLGGCATTSPHLARGARPAISAARSDTTTVAATEQAVAEAPAAADRRARLGRSYLASGRFASAESAFGDALALDPSLARIRVMRALAQLAQGRDADARLSLAKLRDEAPDADLGLALALAGERARAIALLEAAIRQSGGDVRIRQNLGLIYGLEGRWADAAAMAARDVPADQLGERLRRWIQIVQRGPRAADQLIAILGVEPGVDPGQPARLALVEPKRSAPVPVPVTEAVPSPVIPVRMAVAEPADVAGFVVQLGAYHSKRRLEAVWAGLDRHARMLSGRVPMASSLKRGIDGATLHRLAIGGFGSRSDAMRVCSRIRADGGECFVRAAADDRPMTWASSGATADPRG